jgi:transposase-like protein
MVHYQAISCPSCGGTDTCKNGHSENGTQRWRCLNASCPKSSFQLAYTYNARKPGVKEQIDEQTLNSSGARDIARNLGINKNTVSAHLKKSAAESDPLRAGPA